MEMHVEEKDGKTTHFYIENGKKIVHRDGDFPAIEYTNGTVCFFKHGKLHRDHNAPAVITSEGTISYYKNGSFHRENGPAIIHECGKLEFYQKGKLHREVGPAIIKPDGSFEYWWRGRLHNAKGPCLFNKNAKNDEKKMVWCIHGKFHRKDGPAIIRANGSEEWYLYDKRHRYDGPAHLWPIEITDCGNVSNRKINYFLHGIELNHDTFYKIIQNKTYSQISMQIYEMFLKMPERQYSFYGVESNIVKALLELNGKSFRDIIKTAKLLIR